MLKIRNRINIKNSIISGIDCPELCLDKEHFRNYPKKISYKYNTNGFRDHEWPTDLSDVIWCVGDSLTVGIGQPFSDVIWCVGDSFTMGIGQPFEETWPNLLQKKSNKRCLNLGEDGCSNDTMALRIKEICKLHNPKLIVVMWSYLARRRRNNKDVGHDKNDFGDDMDLVNFSKNFKMANESSTNILNLLIPFAFDGIDSLKEKYKDLTVIPQLDYARDHHHFDIMTSEYVTDLITRKINTIDFRSK